MQPLPGAGAVKHWVAGPLGGLPGWNFHSFQNRWVLDTPPASNRLEQRSMWQCVSVHKANPPWSAADPSAASLSDLQPSSLCKSKRHWGSFTFIHQVDRRPIDVSLHALRVPARHNDWPPLPARTIARRHCRQTVLAYWPKPVQTAALVIDRLFIQERGWRSV